MNPILISWNMTKACNLKCLHCYRDAGEKDKDELTTQEAFGLIDEVAFTGFKVLVLSGGEPLLRKDIFEIIKYAGGKKLKTVMGTNGTLITKEAAQMCKDAGLQRAGISVDSIEEEKHDTFRNMPGAFKKAVEGIENLKSAGVDFQIHTTVTKDNKDEIEKITRFAENIGAKAHHLFFLVAAGRGKNIVGTGRPDVEVGIPNPDDIILHRDDLSLQISPQEQENLLKSLADKVKSEEFKIEVKPTCAPTFMRIAKEVGLNPQYAKGCLAAASYCVILPQGDVHPCPYLPIKAGNIRDEKFSRIWLESEIFKELRTQDFKGECGVCVYKNICGGCRAQAYAACGDYMAEDPMCVK